nr:MAG TPA: hypothetical protein [Caudoviricetes sp.]
MISQHNTKSIRFVKLFQTKEKGQKQCSAPSS